MPAPAALDTSAVIASAIAAPSDSEIVSAALLKPCADTGESASTATENRGYMNPIAAPASVHATNAMAGASVKAGDHQHDRERDGEHRGADHDRLRVRDAIGEPSLQPGRRGP